MSLWVSLLPCCTDERAGSVSRSLLPPPGQELVGRIVRAYAVLEGLGWELGCGGIAASFPLPALHLVTPITANREHTKATGSAQDGPSTDGTRARMGTFRPLIHWGIGTNFHSSLGLNVICKIRTGSQIVLKRLCLVSCPSEMLNTKQYTQ